MADGRYFETVINTPRINQKVSDFD